MKRLIIQCDGLGDKTYKELEDKTPLEYAKTPYIDAIIDKAKLGMVTTIPDNYFCGSYYGNLALLGFDFSKSHMKFGPFCGKLNLEDYKDSEYAIICKLVSGKKEIYSIQDITQEELKELCKGLNHLRCVKKYNLNFTLYNDKDVILCINKENIKANFGDISKIEKRDITNLEPKGKDKDIFMEIQSEVHNMLKNHEINKKRIQEKKVSIDLLVFSEGGYFQQFDNFKEWHGMEGTLIAGTKFLKTIGNLVNMKVICPEGATGGMDTDLNAKVRVAIKEVKSGNSLVFLHINATDKLSHEGNLYGKIEAIEKVDKEVIKPIISELTDSIENFKFMIATDHNTYCSTRSHEKGQVPFLIFDGIKNKMNEKHFCEKSCKSQSLNFKSGKELFDYFIQEND